ncbi:DUF2079 domain-containing protein [Dactylosporangium sp. NBC_01737]|uniref:DUF2079 domain-containing protein n=1 Tax=Dactylosporangium sp. NBC_01737 TaxID=2975959 RepID=UPI002E15C270|nr:DUF2079 domain-containing protein [Dactylosporangium sp. NBC_01737]
MHTALMMQNWRQVIYYKSFDNVIFDQTVRAYSRFEPPRVPLKGAYAGLGTNFLQLGDHFSPIHALLAPLYWVWDDMRMLFLAQAAIYAITAAVVWRFTRSILGVVPAYLVSIAFGVSWGLQSAMDVGYHELDCAVLILALIIERLYAGHHRQAAALAGMLLLVKEEMGFLVAALGLLFFIRGHRWWGSGLAFAGVAWFALATKVFIPAFGGGSQQYWTYWSLGSGPVPAAKFALTHPWKLVELVVSTPEKRQLLLWLLAVVVGASLRSPIVLLALPSLTLRLLSDTYTYTTVHWQYNAPLMVIMLMAGVDGIARLAAWHSRWRERRGAGANTPAPDDPPADPPAAAPARASRPLVWTWAIGVLAVAIYGCTTSLFAFSRLTEPDAWQQSAYQRAAVAVVDQIPANATVEADDAIGVLISSRTQHLVLVDLKKLHGSQYVVLGAAPKITWPYSSRQQILDLKQDYLNHGYEEIWAQDDVWLLKRKD